MGTYPEFFYQDDAIIVTYCELYIIVTCT